VRCAHSAPPAPPTRASARREPRAGSLALALASGSLALGGRVCPARLRLARAGRAGARLRLRRWSSGRDGPARACKPRRRARASPRSGSGREKPKRAAARPIDAPSALAGLRPAPVRWRSIRDGLGPGRRPGSGERKAVSGARGEGVGFQASRPRPSVPATGEPGGSLRRSQGCALHPFAGGRSRCVRQV